jgi:hypothetical protein
MPVILYCMFEHSKLQPITNHAPRGFDLRKFDGCDRCLHYKVWGKKKKVLICL